MSTAAAASLLVIAFTHAVDPTNAPEARETPENTPRLWELNASVTSGTPAVLPGLATGVTAELQRKHSSAPIFLAMRAQWVAASGANETWIVSHQQLIAAVAAGMTETVGVGRVWAEVGGGAAGLSELLSRQQQQRIQAAGVAGATASAFSVGPYAFGEIGAGLILRGAVRGFVAGGPTLMRTTVDGGALWRFGGLGRVGIAYDF